jgi:23S rRNA (uracil1939-C5)-methyltransferase
VEGDEVETLELVPSSVVAGGDALARDPDGRIVFVHGALPGERVRVAVTQRKRDFARATTTEVLDEVDGRVAPPCPEVLAGCGGCDYQWIAPALQRRLKVDIVTDALRRLGRVEDPDVRAGPVLATDAYRTSVRCVVVDGRAGYRRRQSHDAVAVERCLVAHPLVDSLIEGGRFGDAREVTLRAGAATGERLALVAPRTSTPALPDDVVVVGEDELRRGRRAWYHEEVAGRRWRISARSFFQVRPDGAEALVDQVRADVADLAPGGHTGIVAGAGVGRLAGTVGAELAGADGRVIAVERGASAVADARKNLADLPVIVVQRTIETWRPERASVVLADPSREGLGVKAVEALAATRAERFVLVSCDPAALGRDARLLGTLGYRAVQSTLVDLFPHTSHVEVVTRFDRSPT